MYGRIISRVAVVTAVVLTACGGGSGGGQGRSGEGATLVFANLFEPQSLDPAIGASIPARQVTHQIFETLVKLEPGTFDLAPGLAMSWTPVDAGRSWSFRLREGVRFHDGSPFDAPAVCANFDRWYHFRGLLQSLASDWRVDFGGFATHDDPSAPKDSLYRSCEARSGSEAAINLTRPSGNLPAVLTLPSFAIASPDALDRYGADRVSGTAESPAFEGSFATEHPVGTGPFKFQSWRRAERIVLVRNDDYWGEKAKLDRVVVRHITDGSARRQALEAGDVHGYDPVDARDIEPLRKAGFRVVDVPAFNVGLLVFNQDKPPMGDLRVRRAVVHALDREALVRGKYPPGSEVAHQYVPPVLAGRAPDPPTYDHDPEEARRLLAEAGVQDLTLEVLFRNRADPANSDPEGLFAAVRADLKRVGLSVTGGPAPDQEVSEAIRSGRPHMFFGAIYGTRADPDEFLGQLARPSPLLGFHPDLAATLDRAEAEVDAAERVALYQRANHLALEFLPSVPVVHVPGARALSPKVKGALVSNVPWVSYAGVTVR